ncbi:MAG: thymidine phosphorylase, partial [Clostridia bacterium]|nr:thymidine phosphorylase [Clostridia bacterium]
MRMQDLIEKKKNGFFHTKEELKFIIDGAVSGSIPDYQLSAWLMAVCFRGMSDGELAHVTELMARSGDTVDLSSLGDRTVDKHSTGGVGDKTTLIIAPLVASLGGIVAKMSGRGLGFTGGTIDKLESIPNFRTELSDAAFLRILSEHGICIAGQSGNLTPADKKLYALRDVTATVDSIPLIASSVMSKKLATGARSIVLDVKTGNGAFMKDVESASLLAQKMIAAGRAHGRNMRAVLTNMNIPLG